MATDVHPNELERLYADHAQQLFAFLAYRCGDRALAEDLLSDTFERALTARRGLDPRRGTAKTWLFAIALNLLRDQQRRARTEARALERSVVATPAGAREGAEDGRLALIEERDELVAALAVLSDEEREAVALRFGAGLTIPELARVLREPSTTVEGRVYRALRKLRSELGADA